MVCVPPAVSARLHRVAIAGDFSVRVMLRGTRALLMAARGTVFTAGHAWKSLLRRSCGVGLAGVGLVVSALSVVHKTHALRGSTCIAVRAVSLVWLPMCISIS